MLSFRPHHLVDCWLNHSGGEGRDGADGDGGSGGGCSEVKVVLPGPSR